MRGFLRLAAYAECLAEWDLTRNFVVNIVDCERLNNGNNMVAHFGITTLLHVDYRTPGTFLERARLLSDRFTTDKSHRHFTGIDVSREYNKSRGHGLASSFNVSCVVLENDALQNVDHVDDRHLWRDHSSFSFSTPGIIFDLIAEELNGELVLYVCGAAQVLQKSFVRTFRQMMEVLLERLSEQAHQAWNEFRPAGRVPAVVPTYNSFAKDSLTVDIEKNILNYPERIAFFSNNPEQCKTYRQLGHFIAILHDALPRSTSDMPLLVAVICHNHWRKFAAPLAITARGNVYLPISPQWPKERIRAIVEEAGVGVILCDNSCFDLAKNVAESLNLERVINFDTLSQRDTVPADLTLLCRQLAVIRSEGHVTGRSLAYIIYTSGSTGAPKGVAI